MYFNSFSFYSYYNEGHLTVSFASYIPNEQNVQPFKTDCQCYDPGMVFSSVWVTQCESKELGLLTRLQLLIRPWNSGELV